MANKDKDDMIGFKDLMNDYGIQRPKVSSRDTEFSYKMLTFLEKESERLGKIIEFCDEKTLSLKSYPQNIKLELEVDLELKREKQKLIQRLRWENSPLSVNIDNMLKTHFG